MTNYIEMCKAIKANAPTNKIVAAVHEMGHYFVATNIKSSLLQVTVDYIQLQPSPSGKWCGFTRIKYTPKDNEIDPIIYNLELCKKKIRIANAGIHAETAMFGTFDPKGYSNDKTMVEEAISYIQSNDPNFNIDEYLKDSDTILSKSLNKYLNTIAERALTLCQKTLNAVVQYSEEIGNSLQ